MAELDIIFFALTIVLLLHAFNALLPQRRPSEFAVDEIGERRPVSTV